MLQLTGQGAADGLLIAAATGTLALAAQAAEPQQGPATAEQIAAQLGLEAHVEGGFFRRTYAATHRPPVSTDQGERPLMSSIFYLLGSESPVGHFHLNHSDIVHYFHLGDPITYYLLHPDGTLETPVMGTNILAGEQLQLTVPGGVWKASRLNPGRHGYGLISEAVSPGFDYADMTLGRRDELQAAFPAHREIVRELTRSDKSLD